MARLLKAVLVAVCGSCLLVTAASAEPGTEGHYSFISPWPTGPWVRAIYAVPADRPVDPGVPTAIDAALRAVREWYREALAGQTFTIGVRTQSCPMAQPSEYYATGDAWQKVIDGIQHCASVRQLDSHHVWVIYADVKESCDEPHELGRGGGGVTILPRHDINGLTSKALETCYAHLTPYANEYGRWLGGLAHEIGHAFGLLHPPGCDSGEESCPWSALMWTGYAVFPDTYLLPADQQILQESRFFAMFDPYDDDPYDDEEPPDYR